MSIIKSPVTRKRIKRFKEQRLAYFSLLFVLTLYLLSLSAELFCNSSPLYVSYEGRSFFPVFKYYTEDTFLDNGKKTRPDYKKINELSLFKDSDDNYMIFPFFKHGPLETIEPESLAAGKSVGLILSNVERVGRVNIKNDYSIKKSAGFSSFAGIRESAIKGTFLSDYFVMSGQLKKAVEDRFNNRSAEKYSEIVTTRENEKIVVALSTYSKRKKPPRSVRIKFHENSDKVNTGVEILFDKELRIDKDAPVIWNNITGEERDELMARVERRLTMPVDTYRFFIDGKEYQADFEKQDIRFPYKPVNGHLLGIDGAGRDVFARIFYGLRISLSFGLLLVFFSMLIGISAGAVQGYFGGKTDITAQRFIEIWSALPFLYIMILMGAVYGRSFLLLLFCYGIFNWIGISYYVRAEFLRLRKKAFVEAAKCMGVPSYKIIFKHILPNAMIPVVTFFPFSLVGAIGSLAALDYLGFGLPPPTPSWGELFFQAQQYRWAWWLIVYPAVALFLVMLAGVFVGDGIRNAYDPKKYTRLE